MTGAMKIQTSTVSKFSQCLSILGISLLAGCGGGNGNDEAPAPAQPPYSQQTFQNGLFRTPVESGSQNRCAVGFPSPRGGAMDPLPVVDGGYGWSRLIQVDQYEENTISYAGQYGASPYAPVPYPQQGQFQGQFNPMQMGISRYTAGKTTIRYHDSGSQYRDGRPNAQIRSNEVCSSVGRRNGGVNLSVIELPLAIDRMSGQVLQNLVLNVGGTSRARLEGLAWEVRDIVQTRGAWNVTAFLSNMQTNGYTMMTSSRLPNGDTEIFLGTTATYSNGQINGKFVRAVYRPDAPSYRDDEYDIPGNHYEEQDDGNFGNGQ
jgi:hypothetical protein